MTKVLRLGLLIYLFLANHLTLIMLDYHNRCYIDNYFLCRQLSWFASRTMVMKQDGASSHKFSYGNGNQLL